MYSHRVIEPLERLWKTWLTHVCMARRGDCGTVSDQHLVLSLPTAPGKQCIKDCSTCNGMRPSNATVLQVWRSLLCRRALLPLGVGAVH